MSTASACLSTARERAATSPASSREDAVSAGQQLEWRGLFDEVGESQALKPCILCGQSLKLDHHHGGSHDPSIQKPQQLLLPDETEVEDD